METTARRRSWREACLLAILVVAPGPALRAQDAPAAPPASGASREVQLEERVRKLEQDNRQVLDLYKSLAAQNAELSKRLEMAAKPPSPEDAVAAAAAAGEPDRGMTEGISGRAARGVGAQGTDARTFEPESASRGNDKPKRRKAIVEFAEGLEIASADDEFKLQFHDLTQAEYRAFGNQGNQSPLKSGFFIPRQRWYFTGRVTKLLEFYTVINRGYGSLDLLDAFLTYRYDPRLRFRIGRMKTPYLYEYYQIAEGDLIAPERSLYAGNLAGNRQMGGMLLGELFQNRAGYAIGAFNGPRRSFQDTNNAKDFYAFLNTRPFLNPKDDVSVRGAQGTDGRTRPNQALGADAAQRHDPGPFEYLNLGGAFNMGYEQNPAQPSSFRTANDQSTAAAAAALSPTFLAFNSNVVEHGERAQWSGHAAWYYKSFFLLSEYGGGFQNYAHANQSTSTRVPFEGYMVQASYFLTGERLTRRVNVVKPLSPFTIKNGRPQGTGAVEVHARFSELVLGRNVFTAGLADPNLWTNQAYAVDVGVNWYLNFYTKIYLDYQHAGFGNPITNGPGAFERASNLFWLRFQLFF